MPAESLCSPASILFEGLVPRAVTFGAGGSEFLPSTATLRRPGAVDTLERTSDGRVRANHVAVAVGPLRRPRGEVGAVDEGGVGEPQLVSTTSTYLQLSSASGAVRSGPR